MAYFTLTRRGEVISSGHIRVNKKQTPDQIDATVARTSGLSDPSLAVEGGDVLRIGCDKGFFSYTINPDGRSMKRGKKADS